MGLTIHYGLSTEHTDVDAVRSVVHGMLRLAKQLPFQEVGGITEFQGEDCCYYTDEENRWLKIQAGRYLERDKLFIKVQPLHIIAFTALPGDGCEPANFGLCRYSDVIQLQQPQQLRVRTDFHGWSWNSFCKTQYAASAKAGGTVNFVRCHGSIVELLDAIQKHGLAKVGVNDESGFWQHRDPQKLATTVGEWNELVAAVVGQLKDAAGGLTMEAPIAEFADFEHLEARGVGRLKKRPS